MITDRQIKALQAEACAAGDEMQQVICMIAVQGDVESKDVRLTTPSQRARLSRMTQGEAREECERVIREAQEEV